MQRNGAIIVCEDLRAGSYGVAVSSGVYFAKIEHASGTRAQKLVLLK